MKNKDNQKIEITNYFEFRGTINSPEHYNRVIKELEKSPEIHNSIMAVNYSDEGYSTFEVIQNTPERLIICFMGTAC